MSRTCFLPAEASPPGGAVGVGNGDEGTVAKLRGFVAEDYAITPDKAFLVLSGMEGEARTVCAVDLATGETLTRLGYRGERSGLPPAPTPTGQQWKAGPPLDSEGEG